MFSDGVLALDAAGALDADHPLISSFCFGSQHLYDWLDRNPRVRMLRTEKTNDPGLIAQQRQMTYRLRSRACDHPNYCFI